MLGSLVIITIKALLCGGKGKTSETNRQKFKIMNNPIKMNAYLYFRMENGYNTYYMGLFIGMQAPV
jgi:hypothetical protein